jgi:hypothetical protein
VFVWVSALRRYGIQTSTFPNTVIEFVIHEGNGLLYERKWKAIITSEKEVNEVIERLKHKGVRRMTIGYTINGFRGKCRSRICPKVLYHLVSYLNMKPQIEDDARLTVSRCFKDVVQSTFGPIKPEEQ